jgi:hypothetical protein
MTTKNVTFQNIKPNQTIWAVNPHCHGRIEKLKVLTSPYTEGKYGFYGFEIERYELKTKARAYLNPLSFNSFFYNENEAKKFLSDIMNDQSFLKYEKKRFQNIEKQNTHCEIELSLKKIVLKNYNLQNYNLPNSIKTLIKL